MRYEKSDRIQRENYSSIEDFFGDVIDTLYDESNYEKAISIIADRNIADALYDFIENSKFKKFEFDLQTEYLNKDNIDVYEITIYDDGATFINSAIDRNGDYYMCDGLIFLHKIADEKAIQGINRRNDVMIFDIDGL